MRYKIVYRLQLLLILFIIMLSCGKAPIPSLSVIDIENKKLIVLTGERTKPVNLFDADFVIIGGGLGGIAAALSICSSGRTVILIEETDRIAGCFASEDTSQFSENRFIETSGSSLTYRTFRSKIREWYEKKAQSQPQIFTDLYGHFSDFSTGNFCFETEAALDVINEMLEKNIDRGKLTVLKRHKVAKIISFNNRIASLQAVDMGNLICNQITGWMFIDATRTGYILPMAGIDYTVGRESKIDTGEPHAPEAPDSLFSHEMYYSDNPFPTDDSGDYQSCYIEELSEIKPEGDKNILYLPVQREPRRIKALIRIVEQDIAADFQKGPRARFFVDSVGIGYFPINIPDDRYNQKRLLIETLPFQIPLKALLSAQCPNFIAGGGTLGATYITSTAYGAPSVEWAIGEAAGEVAALCAGHSIYTHELANSLKLIKELQNWLVEKRGVPIYWYDDVTPEDPDFLEAQLKPFENPDYYYSSNALHYHQ